MANAVETAGPIVFAHHVPAAPLSGFVELLWYWRGHDVPKSRERILPTGNAGLVINLASSRTSDSGISGAKSQSFIIQRTALDELLGIHFKRGGAFPFLGFPASELQDLNITLADLWGEQRARQLLNLLHEASSVEMKFQAIENWLMKTANRPLMHHPAVLFAMKEFRRDAGLQSSAVVARKVNLSQRRFIEVFRDQVGLTPKLYCRIQRFQDVITMASKQNEVDWLDFALSCGYFDQSHFNHDFREFCGLSPTEYLSLRTEYLHHVQVRE